MSIHTIATLGLITLNRLHPVNRVDPITLDTIEEDDQIIISCGQYFSLKSLVEYHNKRPYKGTKFEQHDNKFILNPLTKDFLSFDDTEKVICRSIRSGHELGQLQSRLLVPPNSTEKLDAYKFAYNNSLRFYYNSLKEAIKDSDSGESKQN